MTTRMANSIVARDVWCVTCDVWCAMCDVWRLTCDVWRVTCDVGERDLWITLYAACVALADVHVDPALSEARHTSHVTRHTSHVTRYLLFCIPPQRDLSISNRHVIPIASHITWSTSPVTCQTSHVTRHTSHVTRHTSHLPARGMSLELPMTPPAIKENS